MIHPPTAFAPPTTASSAIGGSSAPLLPARPFATRLGALPPSAAAIIVEDLLPSSQQLAPSAIVRSAPPATLSDVLVGSDSSPAFSSHGRDLAVGVRNWLVPPANAATTTAAAASAAKPPTPDEVKLLQSAFAVFYGERDAAKAEELLTRAISAWERQAPDERAALYRVRGDCYLKLRRGEEAVLDYDTTVRLLEGPGGENADPEEMPAARLGRARAIRSLGVVSSEQSAKAANDYRIALRLSSREDWDTDEEREEDGATRNPYAAWEWGTVRRGAGDYAGAAESHTLASFAFDEIGDRARAVISALDAGIDVAATTNVKDARDMLEKAIKRTTSVEGGDVALLQRVIAKEGEARIALASVLWSNGDRAGAEAQLGEASVRLDQLDADLAARERARIKSGAMPPPPPVKLGFSIDDIPGAGETGCSRFKNDKFVTETLMWPEPLKEKLSTLEKLGKK